MFDINKKRNKQIFFWILVILFFVTSSFLILYSFGYTFNSERGIFVYAGSITLKSNPQDIDVKINDLDVSKKLSLINNSFHIDRIKPDEYILKISAPGFNTWNKKIQVRSGVSTEFWNVLLTRQDYQRTNYETDSNISNFFIAPTKDLIALVNNRKEDDESSELSIDILDSEKNETERVFSSNEYEFTDDKQENIEWSPQSQKIILPLKKGSEKEYFIIDLENPNQPLKLEDLAETSKVSMVRWDPQDKNIVYYMSKRDLYRLDTADPQNPKVIARQISSYDISGKFIYYFQLPNGIVFQTNLDGSMSPQQITTSAPSDMHDDSFRIIVYDKEKIAMKNKSNQLFIFNKTEKDEYFNKLLDNAQGLQFSNDGKKLLFWNEREILTYFTSNWEDQPLRQENDILLVTRYSQPLSNVQWSDDYEHVLFLATDKIKVTELDQRDHSNTFDVATLSQCQAKMVDNFSQDRLYFTNQNEHGENIFQSIDFPEEVGIFGF